MRAAHEAKLARAYGGFGAATAVGGSGWLLVAGVVSLPGAPRGSPMPKLGAVLAVQGIVSLLTSAILLRRAEEHDRAEAVMWSAAP
jgi:hypothetical protein